MIEDNRISLIRRTSHLIINKTRLKIKKSESESGKLWPHVESDSGSSWAPFINLGTVARLRMTRKKNVKKKLSEKERKEKKNAILEKRFTENKGVLGITKLLGNICLAVDYIKEEPVEETTRARCLSFKDLPESYER